MFSLKTDFCLTLPPEYLLVLAFIIWGRFMKFSVQHAFPFGLDELWQVYGEPGYLEAKYTALGASGLLIDEAATNDEEIRVRLERTVTPDFRNVPDWARKMVARDYVVRHENRFIRQSGDRATFNLGITPIGSPINVKGVGEIRTFQQKSEFSVMFDIECRIPVVGKKVAEIFSGKVRESLLNDCDFTRAWVLEKR